jgi:hypothetical protein
MNRVEAYLEALVATLDAQLGTRLVGVWLFGSAALGDFDSRRSDLDVQAVSSVPLTLSERALLTAALSHETLACPVRGLEFVLYPREELAEPRGPAFQLNLNTGRAMTPHVGYTAADEPRFWFVLDVAIGREHGRTLAGPAASDVFPLMPRSLILGALREALTWQRQHDPTGVSAVLAACRAWAWAADGRWLTKAEAAAWAGERLDDPTPVTLALARRCDAALPPLTTSQVDPVVARAELAIERSASNLGTER